MPSPNELPESDHRSRQPSGDNSVMVWWGALVLFALALMLMNN